VPAMYESPWAVDTRNTAMGCSFSQVAHNVWFRNATAGADGIRNTILNDLTGTVTGSSPATIYANSPWLTAAGGTPTANFNATVRTGSNTFCQATLYLSASSASTSLSNLYSPLAVPTAIWVNQTQPPTSPALNGIDLTGNNNIVTAHAFGWNIPSSTSGPPPVCSLTMDGGHMLVGLVTLILTDNKTGSSVDFEFPYSLTPAGNVPPVHVSTTPVYDPQPQTSTPVPSVSQSQYPNASGTVYWYDASAGVMHLKIQLLAGIPIFGGATIYDGKPMFVNISG